LALAAERLGALFRIVAALASELLEGESFALSVRKSSDLGLRGFGWSSACGSPPPRASLTGLFGVIPAALAKALAPRQPIATSSISCDVERVGPEVTRGLLVHAGTFTYSTKCISVPLKLIAPPLIRRSRSRRSEVRRTAT
jgi:hypothetical protein